MRAAGWAAQGQPRAHRWQEAGGKVSAPPACLMPPEPQGCCSRVWGPWRCQKDPTVPDRAASGATRRGPAPCGRVYPSA